MTKKKAARGKPGPKPGFQPAVNLRRAAAAMKPPPPAILAAAEPIHKDPLQRSRQIRTMPLAELRQYAKQVGVRQRDIDELSEDRLRQNCELTVRSLLEAMTE